MTIYGKKIGVLHHGTMLSRTIACVLSTEYNLCNSLECNKKQKSIEDNAYFKNIEMILKQ